MDIERTKWFWAAVQHVAAAAVVRDYAIDKHSEQRSSLHQILEAHLDTLEQLLDSREEDTTWWEAAGYEFAVRLGALGEPLPRAIAKLAANTLSLGGDSPLEESIDRVITATGRSNPLTRSGSTYVSAAKLAVLEAAYRDTDQRGLRFQISEQLESEDVAMQEIARVISAFDNLVKAYQGSGVVVDDLSQLQLPSTIGG